MKKTHIILFIPVVLLMISSCASSSVNPSDYVLPSEPLIQFILPLYTAEKVEEVSVTRNTNVFLDGDAEGYSPTVKDIWWMENTSDMEKTFVVIYGVGCQLLQKQSIKLNGEEAPFVQRIAYRIPIEGVDSVFDRQKKIISKEYLDNALPKSYKYTGDRDVLLTYIFIDITIPAGENVELEFDYTLTDTYRLDFIAGKYCDVECNEAVLTLEKSDTVVIYKQNIGVDEETEKSTVKLDPNKEGLYIDYRVEGYVRP